MLLKKSTKKSTMVHGHPRTPYPWINGQRTTEPSEVRIFCGPPYESSFKLKPVQESPILICEALATFSCQSGQQSVNKLSTKHYVYTKNGPAQEKSKKHLIFESGGLYQPTAPEARGRVHPGWGQ